MSQLAWAKPADAPFAIVDFADVIAILEGNPNAEKRLKEAAKDGFLYLTNYGMTLDEMTAFVSTVQDTIVPLSEEQRASLVDGGLAGYKPLGAESTAKLLNTGMLDDLCWKYTWLETGGPAPNEAFKTCMQAYYTQMETVASSLLKALAKVFELDLHRLINVDQSVAGRGVLRFLNYEQVPDQYCHDEPRDVRMGAHPDLDILTLLYQQPSPNGVPSLQACIADTWVDVPPVVGMLP
jgi:isopenicillin N synthase-like dioxygenase